MTIVVDDAGVGDLLFGVVISAFRCETEEFRYETVDVKYFRPPRFGLKEYDRSIGCGSNYAILTFSYSLLTKNYSILT